jgi:chromosome segregation and condensation protein ScpB
MNETKINVDFKNLVINVKNFADDSGIEVKEVAEGIVAFTDSENIDYANQVINTIRNDKYDVNSIILCIADILDKQGEYNE